MTMNCILRDNCRRSLLAVSNTTSFNCYTNCASSYHVTPENNVIKIPKRWICRSPFANQCQDFHKKGGSKTSLLELVTRNISTGKTVSSTPTDKSQLEFLKQVKQQKRLLEQPEETGPHVIYKGLLTDQMRRLKFFSFTTSAMGLAMQPVLLEKSADVPMGATIAMFGMVGFFTFVTPFLIHLIAKKYVTEIVYDPVKDSYTATTFTFLLRKKETVFTLEELKVPDVPGPFTAMMVNKGDNQKGIPLFVAPESFLKPAHYGRFMGYDKPIDFHLSTVENNRSSEKDSKSSSGASK